MENKELIVTFTPNGYLLDTASVGTKKAWQSDAFMEIYREDPSRALYGFAFRPFDTAMSPGIAFLHDLARIFVETAAMDTDIEVTRTAKLPGDAVLQKLARLVPFAVGSEHLTAGWIEDRWREMASVLESELLNHADIGVSDYLKSKDESVKVAGRIFFHLVEHRSEDYPFAFLATYSTGGKNDVSHVPLENALLEYRDDHEKLMSLLATVSRAADRSDFISGLVESGELFSPLRFTRDDAYVFLREIDLYEASGIVCRIPNWWRRGGATRLRVSIGGSEPAKVGMDALLSFEPSILVGDLELTREELESLMSEAAGLSFIKGKWIEVDPTKLGQILAAYEKIGDSPDMTLAEAIRLQLGIGKLPAAVDDSLVEVGNGSWLTGLRGRLTHPADLEDTDAGDGFKATLRPYQRHGLSWLRAVLQSGFGALLADDMGLGKTIQLLALLEYFRKNGGAKALLVVPASLLGNWQKEAAKFTPELRVQLIHGGSREFSPDDADLFVTTYGMVSRLESLKSREWDVLILDEAQAVKNAGSKQAKSVKELQAKARIAMTGTPIENRLADLWSVFDFLNRGLLGSAKEFSDFAKRLREGRDGYAKLKAMIGPFMLRRLKTDKNVISDLPEKVEIKVYTSLTPKQTVFYSALVSELSGTLAEAEGISRKGLVLASIMKFKQICNHPDQYTGQETYKPELSGKFAQLAEICGTIMEKREKVLIFTQFREITEPLNRYLRGVFEREGLIIHGQTPAKKRSDMVERFNGDEYVPYMVLSLKAGGVGLNLTAANHVVHFDRWWNPAVENQATDRAFRIGQTKNVMVHKFVTLGTVEEKIDAMLEEKQQMADGIVATSGEAWITGMSNEELMALFTLEGGKR